MCAGGSLLSTTWPKRVLGSEGTRLSELNTSVSPSTFWRLLPDVLETVILWVMGRNGRWAVYCCLSESQRITGFVLRLSRGTTLVAVFGCSVCSTLCSSSRGTLKDNRRPAPRWRFPYRSYRYLIWHLSKSDECFNRTPWHQMAKIHLGRTRSGVHRIFWGLNCSAKDCVLACERAMRCFIG